MIETKKVETAVMCYHCGQECIEIFKVDDKSFCCFGCKTVFEILNENNLCAYYSMDEQAGNSLRNASDKDYQFLDEQEIRKKLLSFDSPTFARVTFNSPTIHCVSCIWLLENLQKIRKGVLRSEVNFGKKSVTIDFDPQQIKLSSIAGLIATLGYAPQITLDSESKKPSKPNRSLVLKLSLAGFGFGNIMLFSFPEYLGIDYGDHSLMRIFSWLNLVLATPVFFFSGMEYLRAAWTSFRQRQINIDVPIAAGLVALYFRSAYDIITATGAGYMDSLTGLIFFLLIGRWFQSRTYEALAFDRDFKSYFPLAVHVWDNNDWKPLIIYQLKPGDEMRIRNMEIIPADSKLIDDHAYIDYSFVTGEARPVRAKSNETIYAGGKLIGNPIRCVVKKNTSQSHLTSLWNNGAFKKINISQYQKIIDRSARIFTWIVLALAAVTGVYWQIVAPSEMWLVLTSVLMVACPCALALAAPFTYGTMLSAFGKHQFYLKNADVVERLAVIDSIVLDKTGTVTHGDKPDVTFVGDISEGELSAVKYLTAASTHPLSVMIARSIIQPATHEATDFREIPGKGIEGRVNGKFYRIGSAAFVGQSPSGLTDGSVVFVSIDNKVRGYFQIKTAIRSGMREFIAGANGKVVALLSGDQPTERVQMRSVLSDAVDLRFEQSPHDKLDYIRSLQEQGKRVMMLGDGLNDAGALKQADVGIAVTDDTGMFTPACDGILTGNKIGQLDKFLRLAKRSTRILKIAFTISFFYNAISLAFAVTGHLTPLVAAIIMPISSISVVGFSVLAVNWSTTRVLKSK